MKGVIMPKKISHTRFCFFALVLFIASLVTGCSANKFNLAVPYLDSTQTVNIDKYPFPYQEPTIRPYEFVQVRFAGLNPNVANTLNNYGGISYETTVEDKQGVSFTGQQVDKEGNLNFPLIGKVKASGLTIDQLRQALLVKVEPILTDPFVFVDLPKRGVTILGEVKAPSNVTFPKERPNIFELLGRAGFSTPYADLSKVKVYREMADGQRILGHLNLNDTTFFQSPFFYPQPNDVVYVPASKDRSMQTLASTIAPFAGLIISVVSIVITLLVN
jgi:polysaccharide export outer membrane protein